MNRISRMPIRNVGLLTMLTVLSATSTVHAQGVQPQNEAQNSTRAKLNKPVHLDLGATTVDRVMAALSDQTGLTIKAADYLRERKLFVHIDNLAASAALDSLSELNDWTWYSNLPNQILVTRRRLRMDSTPAAVPRMMQAAIPRDIRTYMKIRTPTEDLTVLPRPLDEIIRTPRAFNLQRLWDAMATDHAALITSLDPRILAGEPIAYAKLTPKQRALLLFTFVFLKMDEADYQLLHGDILPHVADINNAVISMAGPTTLIIGWEYSVGNTKASGGFGTQIR